MFRTGPPGKVSFIIRVDIIWLYGRLLMFFLALGTIVGRTDVVPNAVGDGTRETERSGPAAHATDGGSSAI